MNPVSVWPNVVVFAADFESFFQGLGSEFRGKNARLGWQDAAIVLAIVAAATLVVYVLSLYLKRKERGERIFHPWILFRELCRAQQIDFGGRRALKQLAQALKLEHPAQLFLDIRQFDAGLELPAMQRHRERLIPLRAKLFAGLESLA